MGDIFSTASLDLNFAKHKNLGTIVDATTGSNLVDFTRASSGTYVGSDGLIKTATTNYILYSEEFDNASWTGPAVTWTASAVAAPDGTLTVLKPDKTWTFWAFYDQTNTAWITGYPQAFPFTVTNQWARQSVQITTPAGCTTLRFYPGRVGGAGDYFYQAVTVIPGETYTASAYYKLDTDGTVLVWGAQLEQSSTVGEYIKTTSTINSAPRFDHDPTTGESLGLLVEEQRVNYCLQSEAFGTSPWAASNVTVTANTETSPAATLTADTLAATSANGTVTQPVTTTAIAMTFSVYLKRKTGTGNIDITADGTTWVTQTINDTTWTRCIVTQTAVAGTSNPGVRIVTSGDEVYAWGGQYE